MAYIGGKRSQGFHRAEMCEMQHCMATLVVVVAVVGCGDPTRVHDERQHPVSTPAVTPLIGIYSYAYGRRGLIDVQQIDVVDSARALAEAPTPGGDSKRRRAIGALAAAGTPPRSVGESWGPPIVDEALRALGAPMEQLANEFIAYRDELDARHDEQQMLDKRWVAYETLRKTVGPWRRRCCSCLNDWNIESPASANGVGTAFFKVWVPRPHLDVRPLMDPQAWAECSPGFFKTTKVIQTGPNAACTKPQACTTTEPPFASPPPNRSAVWRGTLFEHYRNAYLPGGTSSLGKPCPGLPGHEDTMYVRNVLRVAKSRPQGNVDQIDYGLCRNTAGTLLGPVDSAVDCGCELGGVDVDCGRTRTWNDGSGNSWVEGFKRVRFTPRAINYDLATWTEIGLRMMIDEIVDEGVCCDPAAGPGGATVMCPHRCPRANHQPTAPIPATVLCNP